MFPTMKLTPAKKLTASVVTSTMRLRSYVTLSTTVVMDENNKGEAMRALSKAIGANGEKLTREECSLCCAGKKCLFDEKKVILEEAVSDWVKKRGD
jgi:hypothetical protein